jgi:two-component sensor histidine kinase
VDFTARNKAEARVEVNREGGTEFRILFPAPRIT